MIEAASFSERRAALALLEAMIPGTDKVPGADEATLARTEEVVQSFASWLVPAWRKAQQALSTAAVVSTGKPFHALDAPAQQELLLRWREDPVLRPVMGAVALIYRFVHFDRKPVYEALGGKLNVVESLEQPAWLKQIHRSRDWPTEETIECDVVVVGSGAGGAVVGQELAERGLAVVFAEEGQHYRRDQFDGGSVSAHQRFYRGAVALGNAMIPIFMGKLVGGSTAVNGGTCFRTPPWVLDRWCEDLESDEFTPAEMSPWFERVESVLEVGPTPEKYLGPVSDIFARGCGKLGWSYQRIARNAPGCEGTGFCNYGCRSDARKSTNLSYIPMALRRGAVLYTGLRAERVIIESGRAVGLEGRAEDGRLLKVRARAVVLAGGSIPTPLFLLRQGICNASHQVGRNLTLHPSGSLSALFDEPVHGADYVPQGHVIDQFAREGMMILTALGDRNVAPATFPLVGKPLMEVVEKLEHFAAVGTLIADSTANGRVWWEAAGHSAVTYNMQPEDSRRVHLAMVRTAEMFLAAGAKRIYPLIFSMPILERDELHKLRAYEPNPSDMPVVSYHPLGTCKMGNDPKTSVVDTSHQAHEVKNLFIVDGSTVPGPLGVNPQLTIMAMATRASRKIAQLLAS